MRKKFSLCLFFTGIVLAPSAMAVPVVETLAVVNALAKQYVQLKKQYDRLGNQLDTIQDIVDANQGHYGYGDFGESREEFKGRAWSPDTWDDALKGLSGDNPSRYKQLLVQYQHSHPTLSNNEYARGASHARVRVYSQNVSTNKAASVQATYAFNNINTHLQDIHRLTTQIEDAPNSKAAIDLNTRLVAELAYISVQELKMQALLNQQLAQQSANEINAEGREAKFNQLPNG